MTIRLGCQHYIRFVADYNINIRVLIAYILKKTYLLHLNE